MKYFPPMFKNVDQGENCFFVVGFLGFFFVNRKELSSDFYKFRTKPASNPTY